jgi:cupin fold WbuC family metalloprotein
LNSKLLNFLIFNAKKNITGKCRICFHDNPKSSLHEMIIIHTKKSYVPPHKHIKNPESMNVILGKADLLIFNSRGKIKKKVAISNNDDGIKYYRIDKNVYHSLIIKSQYFIFQEVTKGPFVKKNMIIPTWENNFKKKYFI